MSKTNIATRESDVIAAFELDAIKQQLNALLDGNAKKVESFKTKVLTLSLDRGLIDCSPTSIIHCGLQALTLDLPIQGGQGYVVKYGGEAQFDIGYKGWQILAMRAGFSVLSDVVYMCDVFSQSGFGHDRQFTFVPNIPDRKGADDKWARQNLLGVLVSIRDVATKVDTLEFVDADMIHKIVGKSPSAGSKYSPHQNWAEQMFKAKAIKQVLSKFPIDLASSSLGSAIEMVNHTEQTAQTAAQQAQQSRTYTPERFAELFAQWSELVKTGKKSATSIITQISNAYTLTAEQMEQLMTLAKLQPINGEVVDVEAGEVKQEQAPEAAEFFKEADAKAAAQASTSA